MSDNDKKTLAPEYFENVYDNSDDPWDFASSAYEAAKYAATIAALPAGEYEAAFEIGCSIGVLTARLATFCQSLLAVDVSEKALAQARARCARLPNVRFENLAVPDRFPDERFDLILVSEVGYYLSCADWENARVQIFSHLKPAGIVVLVHWTHFVHDYPQTGEAVHDSFAAWSAGKFNRLAAERTADYRLDVWKKL